MNRSPGEFRYNRIRPTKVTRCPRRVIAVCCEHQCATHPASSITSTSISTLNRWSIWHAKLNDRKTWKGTLYTGSESMSLWTQLQLLAVGRKQIWIVTPSVSELLAVSNGYLMLTERILSIPGVTKSILKTDSAGLSENKQRPGFLTLFGPTEIIHGRLGETDVHFVSASNYGKVDIANLVEKFHPSKKRISVSWTGGDKYINSSDLIAESLANWYTSMIDEWRASDCGTWGHTAAQLAHSYWRRKYAKGTVVKHLNEQAHRLERAALYGGRADLYKWGNINGPLYRVDVRSMYPYILSSRQCPVALSTTGNSVSNGWIVSAAKTHCIIATVKISTKNDVFPFRLTTGGVNRKIDTESKHRTAWVPRRTQTIYPTGQFTTTLIGCELMDAINTGCVDEIYEYAAYRYSDEFMPFMAELCDKRMEHADNGDEVRSQFYKLLGNSFAGKWARKPGGWTTDKNYPSEKPWEVWVDCDRDTGEPVKCRAIGHVPQVWRKHTDKPSGCPVILAWLTSEGRSILRKLIGWAGETNVVATDTDGLWLKESGYNDLKRINNLFGEGPGHLRLIDQCEEGYFMTPRHYRVGTKWHMSGFAAGWCISPDGLIHDYSRSSIYPTRMDDSHDGVRVTHRAMSIQTICDTGRLWHSEGYTQPHAIDTLTRMPKPPVGWNGPKVQRDLFASS